MSSLRRSVVILIAAVVIAASAPASAQTDFTAKLYPRNEVPAISTFALGTFHATLNAERTELAWQLDFEKAQGHVTQAHIHFAQAGVNGGIMVFLCSNLGNGPGGTQECPTTAGSISGVARATEVISGASAQGVEVGNFFEFSRALLQGVAYANIHSDLFPGGELRGQIVKVTAGGGAAEAPVEE
jgi:hypothetical protein